MDTLHDDEDFHYVMTDGTDLSSTNISNALLRSQNISLDTKGILVSIQAMPGDARMSLKDLAKIAKIGSSRLKRMIDEACNAGFMREVEHRDENGKLLGTTHFFSDEPHAFGNIETALSR